MTKPSVVARESQHTPTNSTERFVANMAGLVESAAETMDASEFKRAEKRSDEIIRRAHTPVPWIRDDRHVREVAPYDDQGHRLSVARLTTTSRRHGEAEANAEFIVRACNAHTKLVEALQALISRCLEPANLALRCLLCDAVTVDDSPLHHDARCAMKQAEQALRLASGKEGA